ncbi:MAG: hypothetical protein AAFS10_15990 [Myxococcota bacterium]
MKNNWLNVVTAVVVAMVIGVGFVAHAEPLGTPVSVNAASNVRGGAAHSEPGTLQGLSRDDLDFGFRGIARSAEQCLARHRKNGDAFPLNALRIEVLVNSNGHVGRFKVPRQVRWTTFNRCMKSHSDRWLFPTFKGRPIRAAKTFRIDPN